ncbi:MAG: hypothetical protein CSA53_04490 [Gammaproteobacteria bacterium]|nr:MAG: hypothetical protein CSA53_04490 [Gammaproteobacteria bacterium]
MLFNFSHQSLAHQVGVIAATLCFLVCGAVISLTSVAVHNLQSQQVSERGEALSQQLASEVNAALETGDLLGIAAILQRYIDNNTAIEAAVYDLDRKPLARVGKLDTATSRYFPQPLLIGTDSAGELVVGIDMSRATQARQRANLAIFGLALLLSFGVYWIARYFGQKHSEELLVAYDRITLNQKPMSRDKNEWHQLKAAIDGLPLDLLNAKQASPPAVEHYKQAAVLYIQLDSLANYVETLDETALTRYTHQLHQIIYGAAGFYQGSLEVVRQFGLAVFFSGGNKAGSPAFRAASCAWLIQELAAEYRKKSRLGMNLFMAVSVSDAGRGGEGDIYPDLYTQHEIDELQQLCANKPPRVLLTQSAQTDGDIVNRISTLETDLGNSVTIDTFEQPYDDLLERQLHLVWQRNLAVKK